MQPMRAFVVRPFGVKDGIDFDRVHRELLSPVLATFNIEAQTTGAFAQAGNIRADMFEQLMIADLVIADISIHNANVYYELGVRHALREGHTILIRSRRDEVPFDLKTDRYLEYAIDDPAASAADLAQAVRQTLDAKRCDSPVFLLVPALKPHDPETLVPAPPLFWEAVRAAEQQGDRTRLSLFAEEVASLEWNIAAWRVIGRAQVAIRHFAGAKITWEQIRSRRPDDVEANLALATVYQRLGDLTSSSAAILRAAEREDLLASRRAEALALRGSNLKNCWAQEWRAVAPADRVRTALCSGFLYDALGAYLDAFHEDQNHFYSGLNALALTTVALGLARAQPDQWIERFDSEATAKHGLEELETSRDRLEASVRMALDAAAHRARRSANFDIWRELSEASFALLTSVRAGYVARKYGDARRRLAESPQGATMLFPAEAEARQIRLYLELDVLVDNSRAALKELGVAETEPATLPQNAPPRVVVFSGHRLDKRDRPSPRFPAEKVSAVRGEIKRLLERELEGAKGEIEGFAGGASGSDLIFHDVCAELGIPTTLLLALPPDRYLVKSVQDSGPEWVDKFWALCRTHPPRVLGDSDSLPPWLTGIKGYSIWQRNNLWTLATGLSKDRAEVTLMLVWDGQPGDGPGGTADMAALAQARGVKVLPAINPTKL
jgi:hypothetical protein